MPSDLVQQATPVDVDKLWRVRVAKELHSGKSWDETYGYMVERTKKLNEAMEAMNTEAGIQPKKKIDTKALLESKEKNDKPTIDPFQKSFDSQIMGKSSFARKSTKWT